MSPTDGASVACPQPHLWPPLTELHDIRAEIERQVLSELLMIGDGARTVVVGLRSTSVCLARELFAAYGPKLEMTVGLQPFPPRAGLDRGCPIGNWPFGNIPFLEAALHVPQPRVVQGAFFKAKVRFVNRGAGQLHIETSSNFNVYLFQPARGPVGAPEGASLGTGLMFDLAPGKSRDVDAFGGTASCDSALGYVVPAGSYDARALIDQSPPGGGVHVFWSDATRIEVVAP